MSFPFSRNTHEWKRVERLWFHNWERQAEIIQKSWVYDYAHIVNDFVNSTLSLTGELSKFWLEYSDISAYIKGQFLNIVNEWESLNLSDKLSFDEQEMLMEFINRHIVIILDASKALPKVKSDEKDFSSDVKVAFLKTLWLEVSIITDLWRQTPELVERYNSLFKVIQSNPEWWETWKYKIEIIDEWINFIDSRFILNISGSLWEKKWDEKEDFPSSDDYRKIFEFTTSAWEENKSDLMKFLWLKPWKYWTNSKWGYLLKGFAYHHCLDTNLFSYSPQSTLYNTTSVTKY